MKKRFLPMLAAAVAAAPSFLLFGCAPRSQVLKIYNWGDYIEDSLIGEFEGWYKEQTGEHITVKYDTFDTNETMLMRIETQKADYDLVCPSDYIAERMIKSGLAKKVDAEIFDPKTPDLFYDGLADMVAPFDENNEYFVPYVWGTFGIMYDTNKIDAGSEKAESWGALWSDEWKQTTGKRRVLMKDSVRDAYSVAMIYANTDKLAGLSDGFTDYNAEYRKELVSYFSEVTDDTLATAQKTLIEQKKAVCKYEVDDGKNDMVAGTTDAYLGLFWSCDAGLIMLEDGGDHFYYAVPKEGSNVWVDGWLIPKYAKNEKAANYFLKFINTHEFAAINFDYMGTSIAVKSVMEEAKIAMEEDDEFFEGFYDGFKQMYIDMMFPSETVIARSAVMRDFGVKMGTALDSMWIDVKTS